MLTKIPPTDDYLDNNVADAGVSEELAKDCDNDDCDCAEDVETDLCGICDMLKLRLMATKATWRCYDELATLKELLVESYKFIEESHKNIMDKMENFQMQVEFIEESVKQHNLARDEVLVKRCGKEE